MIITKSIKMDLANQLLVPAVDVMQNDACTRALAFRLFSSGEEWPVPEGVSAAVSYRKPDGTVGLYDTLPDGSAAVTLAENVATAVLAEQALTVAGKVDLSVVLQDGLGKRLATFGVALIVHPDPAAGKTESDNYISLRAYVPQPAAGAAVGQYLEIEEVSESGRVIKVKAVDAPAGSGVGSEERTLILSLFRNAAYTANMSAAFAQLEALWGGEDDSGEDNTETEVTLSSISATYSGGSVTAGTAVSSLTGIVVTATYSDGSTATVTDYTLSGTIAEGSNTITVSYGGMTTTFTVTGVAEEEETHTHSYTSEVTTEATCETAGVRTYTCSCGESYTETIAATGHTYVDGTCTVCGAADPDYEEPDSGEPVYQLAEETTFDGTGGIDTGYVLLDEDKSFSICVDFTGNGNTVWSAAPNASNGLCLSNRGGYFRSLYAIEYVDISGGKNTNHKVIATHTKGADSIQYYYIYEGGTRVDGELVKEGLTTNTNFITDGTAKTVKLGMNYTGEDNFTGTIHKFAIYERVISADEISEFLGVSA